MRRLPPFLAAVAALALPAAGRAQEVPLCLDVDPTLEADCLAGLRAELDGED
ncbi:hypothetical protein [Wenxinia marina]|uniref:Uncharacterized protein n=1 Tax=Wenxinia marina DSM 24838 TaxID=1123501 RepID=A0A0D0NGI7_9RHOB|nr:hypothetical protein [Wenxinia marina]KIQ67440.1 hypothetical protein Wenmar_03863 [Wenxinia marina DSM 24838]GGL69503.1 hypothetical protein GCM10011392_24960 [Wenxinia marina]